MQGHNFVFDTVSVISQRQVLYRVKLIIAGNPIDSGFERYSVEVLLGVGKLLSASGIEVFSLQ